MIIKNFENLASNSLRKQALLIAEAGLLAIQTEQAVQRQVMYDAKKDELIVRGEKHQLNKSGKLYIVGFGKASYDAVSTLYTILGERIACGFVVDLKGGSYGSLTCTIGSHPFPTLVNVAATKKIVEVMETLGENDTLLCVVSGGGSSLLCYPYNISCESETQIVHTLMKQGANIEEMNTVRKHLSLVKGGQLARAVYPATIINLVFSDVPGDDLSLVASGPTMMDHTTVRDAQNILQRYRVLEICGMPSCDLKETPKETKYFEKVKSYLLVSGQEALLAMKEKAANLGYKVVRQQVGFAGEARDLAGEFLNQTGSGECFLGAGESTVTVKVPGKGGRNLEMALSALLRIRHGEVLLAIDSDGYDNTDFAGAIVDATTMEQARRLSLEPKVHLDTNASYQFFEQVGDYIDTGLTGSNVADLVVVLKE